MAKAPTPDNENDSWSTLGLAALRVLQRCEQKKDSKDESGSGADDKQRALDQAEFVRAGVERIRRFEERAAGVDAPVRKRRI